MTTIVVDIKNAKLYSDTLTTTYHNSRTVGGNEKDLTWQVSDVHNKIFKCRNFAIAGTGCMDSVGSFAKHYPDGIIPKPTGKARVIVLSKRDGAISTIEFESVEVTQTWYQLLRKCPQEYRWKSEGKILTDDWFTMGSGEEYALGALLAGATIEQTYSVVSSIDVSTNDDIVELDIP